MTTLDYDVIGTIQASEKGTGVTLRVNKNGSLYKSVALKVYPAPDGFARIRLNDYVKEWEREDHYGCAVTDFLIEYRPYAFYARVNSEDVFLETISPVYGKKAFPLNVSEINRISTETAGELIVFETNPMGDASDPYAISQARITNSSTGCSVPGYTFVKMCNPSQLIYRHGLMCTCLLKGGIKKSLSYSRTLLRTGDANLFTINNEPYKTRNLYELNKTEEVTYRVNTGRLADDKAQYIGDLLGSDEVYLQSSLIPPVHKGYHDGSNVFPVIINTTNMAVKNYRSNGRKWVEYEFDVKMA